MLLKIVTMETTLIKVVAMAILLTAYSTARKPSKTLDPVARNSVTGSTRGAGVLSKLAANSDVQEGVVGMVTEGLGEMVDKNFKNIEEAQEKSADFLKKKIKLDITPGKGWEAGDMFKPPEYHMSASMEGEKAKKTDDEKDEEKQVYTYPSGVGSVIMNGCWGTGYEPGDPCFNALANSTSCMDMIDGAAFIGVGFDGSGEYSPESRKMSIIQRNCAGKSFYDGVQVPDTMNVHGIYDTSALMTVFSSREEYREYLQKEAGVSGSVVGFYAGVKQAWGSSESTTKQMNLAVFDIDVDRYEIFKDEVKPQDLSRSFLREFIDLPTEYFTPGAPSKYQDFILRWGTHYIKSARFGGQLEIRKLQTAEQTASKEEFAEESETEFKSLFFSGGARSSTSEGNESKSQKNYMSTSVVVQGGSQDIAAIISDLYSPTFKNEFKNWLSSIPTYPKAFKFLMGSITDLVDFRVNDLFPEEDITWGCEFNKDKLEVDDKVKKSFYLSTEKKKVFCEFGSRDEMDSKIKRKRMSLKRAIEFYMEQGPISISDISIPAGEPGCEHNKVPSCEEIQKAGTHFQVLFDMMDDLKSDGNEDIPKTMLRMVRYSNNKWFTADKNGRFHIYNGYTPKSNDAKTRKRTAKEAEPPIKVSIFGLVLTCEDSVLVLKKEDYEASKKLFSNLENLYIGRQLAKLKWPSSKYSKWHVPCNVKWSNALRFDPNDIEGKCIHFTAASKGSLYVVLSAIPNKKDTWYYVEISPNQIGIYKGKNLIKDNNGDSSALPLGDALLYQSYFVCVKVSEGVTIVEYGKDTGDQTVYVTMFDRDQPIQPRFYSFANGEYPVQVMDAHIITRSELNAKCKGNSKDDLMFPYCVEKCHEACDPLAGCTSELVTGCKACRYAMEENQCVLACKSGKKSDEEKKCSDSMDVLIKANKVVSPSNYTVSNLPSMDDFTICFWYKLPECNEAKCYKKRSILQYSHKSDSNKRTTIMGIKIKEIKKADGRKLFFESNFDMKDGKSDDVLAGCVKRTTEWRMYCVIRERATGLTTIKFDGQRNGLQSIQAPGAPLLNGNLILGGYTIKKRFEGWVTGLNIWNKILTQEEISKMAMFCGGVHGNVRSWKQISKNLATKLDKDSKATPSKCKGTKNGLPI